MIGVFGFRKRPAQKFRFDMFGERYSILAIKVLLGLCKKSVRVLYRKALQHKDVAKQGMTGKNVSKMLSFDENSTYTQKVISLPMLGILFGADFIKHFQCKQNIYSTVQSISHSLLNLILIVVAGLCLMLF